MEPQARQEKLGDPMDSSGTEKDEDFALRTGLTTWAGLGDAEEFFPSTRQNETQSTRAESAHKGVNCAQKASHKHNDRDTSRQCKKVNMVLNVHRNRTAY